MVDASGPAFPNGAYHPDGSLVDGMTLRDYFAAQAMNGILAFHRAQQEGLPSATGDPFVVTARSAYRFADAMLKERSK